MENVIYISQLLGKKVLDAQGKFMGKVGDFYMSLTEESPQTLDGLVIHNRRPLAVPVKDFASLNPPSLSISPTDEEKEMMEHIPMQSILLKRDILDKQIIDTEGKKIVRVNDLQVHFKEGEAVLLASDVGFMGIARRLGLERVFSFLFSLLRRKLPHGIIPWGVLEPIDTELSHLRLKISYKKLERLHPSDIAAIASQLSAKERVSLFGRLDTKVAAETLHELEPEAQVDIVEGMDREHASDILEVMPSDEAADVIGDLPESEARDLLSRMERKEAEEVEELLQYPDDTAGGFMTKEFVAFSGNAECEEVILRLRKLAPSAETIYYLYIVDEDLHLEGVFTLRDLIVSAPDTHIERIMRKNMVKVLPEATKEEVADVISKYNLLALPVVDKDNVMLGIVTVDDIVDYVVPSMTRKKQVKL